jgi:hypothetical protein
VIPKICNLCEQQGLVKRASLYWAWVNANGVRRAWKQQICPDCFRAELATLIVKAEDPVLLCPACGIGTADDYDAVYLTYCLPGMPKGQSEFPLCGPCAVVLRNKALKNAQPLEDRGALVGGPQPQEITSKQAWADLGYLPSARGNGG